MDISLKNKNALVCGSSKGIGKATAMVLAELGANVTLLSRNEEELKIVLRTLPTDLGQKHQILCADHSQTADLKEKITNYVSNNPTTHILVNNSGGPPVGSIIEADIQEFQQAYTNHLIANHILVQALVDGMKSARYGRIINIISTSVKQPLPNLGVSNTTRGAVASWSKTLSNELGRYGITVNNVLPGVTKTQRLEYYNQTRAKQLNKTIAEVEKETLAEVPLNRFAEPVEIAYAIAFLASPVASYINGINLPVDGGRIKSM